MTERRRFKQTTSVKDDLIASAVEAREQADLANGIERVGLLKKARQANAAAHIDAWVNSEELQPPN